MRSLRIRLGRDWFWLVAWLASPAFADEPPVDLQVSRVALFSSGVGYFERESSVTGDVSAELKFRADQINDILKSLVVQDLGGGKVGVVGYSSRDPVEKALKSFGVDITGKPTLAQLLDQLRGEPIELSGPRTIKGVIIGVEKQTIALGDKNTVQLDILNVLTETGIQQLRINELTSIKLLSEKVDAELRKALLTLADSHDADKKTVTLEFNGKGNRKVRAAYLLEAPIWKTSYRLVLSDDKKPFLQGWATVENATEEDWKDVRLSLVSGRPISFRMDLYTPLYVPRPLEQLEIYASLRPPEYAAGIELKKSDARPAGGAGGRGGLARRQLEAEEKDAGSAGEELARVGAVLRAVPASPAESVPMHYALDLAEAGVESVASAQEAGELFEYVIDTPVSIARQHSAMLPIVNQEVAVEKVSIYNPGSHPKHPLNGLILTNSTKLNLVQGPVTVFDGNTYAGDAKLPDLRPDEKRLVAYALDLGTEVTIDSKSHPEQLIKVWIKNGTFWAQRKYIDERTYNVKNKDAEAKMVILEQPYSQDWKLQEPKEPYERTPNLLRFKVSAKGQDTTKQAVKLEMVSDQAVALGNLDGNAIEFYLRAPTVSEKVKQALQRIVALRSEVNLAAERKALAEKNLNDAKSEQGRVRENIKTLDKGSDSYQRQMRKFDEFETKIEKGTQEVADLTAAEQAKRAELNNYLLSLDLE